MRMCLLVTSATALRRMHVVRLNSLCHSRECHKGRSCSHPGPHRSGTCGKSEMKSGLSFVPPGKLTRTSLVMFHTYGPTESNVAVVKDVPAFDRFLGEVLASNATGANNVVRELSCVLHEKRKELAPLLAAKKEIDVAVENRHLLLLRCLTLLFLLVQFVVLFRWVFVVFDWNLVEPLTYFISYTVVWMGIVFYSHYARDFTWEAMFDVLGQNCRARMYRRAGIDAVAVKKLQQQIRGIEAVLSRY